MILDFKKVTDITKERQRGDKRKNTWTVYIDGTAWEGRDYVGPVVISLQVWKSKTKIRVTVAHGMVVNGKYNVLDVFMNYGNYDRAENFNQMPKAVKELLDISVMSRDISDFMADYYKEACRKVLWSGY